MRANHSKAAAPDNGAAALRQRLRSPERRRADRRRTAAGYVFLSPVILGILLFTLGPILYSLVVSFTDYVFLQDATFTWNNFANYTGMFRIPTFTKSIGFTFKYAFVSVPVSMCASFFLAFALNKPFVGMKFFRAVFYLPVIIPVVASTIIFKDMFAQMGIINELIYRLGFDQIDFFGTGDRAFLTLIIYSLWGAGGSMLLWLAAFNGVSPAYYESAEIDGANGFVKLFRITLPMVTPMIFYNLVTSIIFSMQAFTQVYMLTNGGPTEETMTMVFTIYNYGIKYREIGQASSMAWFLFVIIFGMTMVVFKTNKWVYYEGGDA